MKYFVIFLLGFSVFAGEDIKIKGTLFKKDNQWMIFVESNDGEIKKGVFQLVDVKKEHQKDLTQKKFVFIVGIKEKCESKYLCLRPLSIKPIKYDPLIEKPKDASIP